MIIVDTSVWISFFKGEKRAACLREYILDNRVSMHPFIQGELLLGGISNNSRELLSSLQTCKVPDTEMIYEFIKARKLSGTGIGWVDTTIISSAILSNYHIATFDEKLNKLCKLFKVQHNFE